MGIHIVSVVFVAVWAATAGMAQQTDTVRQTDAVRTGGIVKDQEILNRIPANDSIRFFYQRLKKRMYKRRLTRALYDFLLRDSFSQPANRTLEKPADPNCGLEGRFIGNIRLTRLDPLGPNVSDTLRTASSWLEKSANAIHRITRERIIRKSLMFRRGYPFVAAMISDNERILRQVPNLTDARIYAVARPGALDTVDIVVVTQDVWSIAGGVGTDFSTMYDANLTDINFLGLGHEQSLAVSYSSQSNPLTLQPRGWGVRSLYRVPFIGGTFVTGSMEVMRQWNQERYAAVAGRSFLTPSMKYAGGLEVSRNRFVLEVNPLEPASPVAPVTYDYADAWLGRSFRTRLGGIANRDRSRVVVAARTSGNYYRERPAVRADTNQLFQHRFLNLYSIGFSTRNYLRDILIYGFGRTEDVPYGSLLSLTGGVERTEFGVRNYMGMKAAHGSYYRSIGYLLLSLNAGSYLRNRQWEQGVLRVEANYFSRLIELKSLQVRQFVNIRYTRGFGRFNGEFIDIGSANGLRGINNPAFRGRQSVVLNLETVVFSPLSILGFQSALFAYADLGWVGGSERAAFRNPLYQGYGVGVRLRNENLVFNTFQFRLGFYAGIPGISNPLRTEFSELPRTRLPDFNISAPEVIPFGNIGVR